MPVSNKLVKSDLVANALTPVYSSESSNNGIAGYTDKEPKFIVDAETPMLIVFGDHTRSFNIAMKSFCVMDNVKVLKPVQCYSLKILLFILATWQKCIPNKGYSRHWKVAQKVKFNLPLKSGKIDFDFMEKFIAELEAQHVTELRAQRVAELEAYLLVTGLKDTHLSSEEEQALRGFDNLVFEKHKYKTIFNKIQQGRRLKKANQMEGDIPFVMSGTTNTGIVGYISNPIANFPKNSITVDIFGNAFYRNDSFGAGDDTGVYWNTEIDYSKEVMLYFTAAMEKSLYGKYSYGNKLRSSQSFELEMVLPVKGKQLDYDTMETIISAVQKLVIKDVVAYADERIAATKSIIENN